ncbi:50S ribosomal protein L21 [Candidatus Falkowbacteria bacterium RIFOXYB2_FULL_38_15]|uniref:Large ribosomal subunit protein bL21 n=1 Tax=Candidatus Falkowbacteria bacterium RIFOXYA2_FULL_38_12 TaxID=1797993 RepID=A0A1F5S263_9BACT|nr:MAG: 50S ribosomal protein L21 [Candidatus Falkowbacteria bacterium RIFOXYA2_FULL_38_12]OGF33689.1 MAG: 50S ribosomal protein L21 [Candidatus Falkowbacteria bacterium RIFOXYB2_FULL_38_15]OGF42049.1 MAG: 50S ribosomal protein L21 [Candidatus Falkowbacteria bacterium RIFOXYD2_FULL_39_16]
MFAIIKTGGKQYKVKQGETLKIEKIVGNVGDKVDFDKVLLLADEEGKDVKIGKPMLLGAKVSAEILEQGRDKKVNVIKYKPKVRYRRKAGHRQMFTKVKVVGI